MPWSFTRGRIDHPKLKDQTDEIRQASNSSVVPATGRVFSDRGRHVCRLLVLRDQWYTPGNEGYGGRDRPATTAQCTGSNRSAEPEQLQSCVQSSRRRICRIESTPSGTTRADDGSPGYSGSCARQRFGAHAV